MVYIYTTPILYPKFLKNLEALGIRLFKLNIMYVYDNTFYDNKLALYCTYPKS